MNLLIDDVLLRSEYFGSLIFHYYNNSLFTGISRIGASKFYYEDGLYHREDGPAITYCDGYEAYYKHGLRHRKDGPAIIRPDGTKLYYLNGKYFDNAILLLNKSNKFKL